MLGKSFASRALGTIRVWLRTIQAIDVAVGTTIADRPPHRTVRARLRIRLPPWMSGVKTCRRIRVQSPGYPNPAVQNRVKPIPGCPALLTAAEQNKPPQPSQPVHEDPQVIKIARDSMVLVVTQGHLL